MTQLNEKLIEVIQEEVQFQRTENQKNDDKYRLQAQFHTTFVEELFEEVTKYPHFASALLEQHIAQEEAVFGQEVEAVQLTPYEEGRIYSLVRAKHMLRITKERFI